MVNSVGTQNKPPNINPQVPHFVKLLTNIRYGTLVIQSSMLIYNKKRYFYYKKFTNIVHMISFWIENNVFLVEMRKTHLRNYRHCALAYYTKKNISWNVNKKKPNARQSQTAQKFRTIMSVK